MVKKWVPGQIFSKNSGSVQIILPTLRSTDLLSYSHTSVALNTAEDSVSLRINNDKKTVFWDATPSQKFENLNKTTHFNIPGDSIPHSHCCQNFKSHMRER
jgi:hypothetical protein